MPGFDHFDLLAPIYDRFFRVRDTQCLINILALPTQGTLLDAGGGTGRIAQAILPFARQVIVADISRGMLARAAAKSQLITVCAPSEALPFENQTFDRIIMVDALHHVYSARATALELWRVLKPGGRLVIEEPDIRTPPVWIVAALEKLTLMRSHFVSPPKIAAYFSPVQAHVSIQKQGYTAWIIVEKPN